MTTNFQGKKVKTQQDDEVRYIFNPTKQSYNNNLKNIMLWTSFGEEENRTVLVGSFEIKWKIPYHNILVEFLNN
jgi:hypothetical protein